MKIVICLSLFALALGTELNGVHRTKVLRKRQTGGGCLYNGQTYQQGQRWEVPCKYDCVCNDGTTGTYRCTEKCPHYDNLPNGCYMVQQPNSCCSKPQCNFQTSGGGQAGSGQVHMTGSNTGMVAPVMTSCQDALPNCKDYGSTVCSNPDYDAWVKEKCASFCNKCGGSMTGSGGTMTGSGGTMTGSGGTMTGTGGTMTGSGGTITGTGGTMTGSGGTITGTGGTMTGSGGTMGGTSVCADAIPNCSAYGQTVCTSQQYKTWVQQNCRKYCNACGISSSSSAGNPGSYVIPGYQGEYTGSGSGGLSLTGGSVVSGGGVAPGSGSMGGTSGGTSGGDGGFSLHFTNGGGSGGTGSMSGGTQTSSGTCTGDRVQNCKDYGVSVCSDSKYAAWVAANCCMFCLTGGGSMQTGGGSMQTGGGSVINTGMGQGSGSGSGVSGHSTGCVYKGHVYQQGQTWKDGCQFSCSCQDGASGRYVCKPLCVTWQLPSVCTLNEPAPGKCCKTPNCPSFVQITYPQGYVEQ